MFEINTIKKMLFKLAKFPGLPALFPGQRKCQFPGNFRQNGNGTSRERNPSGVRVHDRES
jgi:hypothetical protein